MESKYPISGITEEDIAQAKKNMPSSRKERLSKDFDELLQEEVSKLTPASTDA